jgi:cyclopropane fatty-acyl-phospholipid synthase-like methyltransferase
MMEATNIGPGKHVLDIGCRAGHSSELIKTSGATVIGVDASQGMVEYAKKTFDGIDFQVGELEELAIGLAGLEAVEKATRQAVEPLTAQDGRVTFDSNMFIYVVGQA